MELYPQGDDFAQMATQASMARPASVPRNKIGKLLLPPSFVPSQYSVICGRGKVNSTSPGNRRLKLIVSSYLQQYSKAQTKADKSSIVSDIIARVRDATPHGAFIKKEQGRFWEVEDGVAREKIGCMLRDWLYTQYKSSTKAKVARRQAMKTNNAFQNWQTSNSMQGLMSTYKPKEDNTFVSDGLPDIWSAGDCVDTPLEQGTDEGSLMESTFSAVNHPSTTSFSFQPCSSSRRTLRDILPMSSHNEIMMGVSADTAPQSQGVASALNEAFDVVSNLGILREKLEVPDLSDDMSSIVCDDELLSYADDFPLTFDHSTFFD